MGAHGVIHTYTPCALSSSGMPWWAVPGSPPSLHCSLLAPVLFLGPGEGPPLEEGACWCSEDAYARGHHV